MIKTLIVLPDGTEIFSGAPGAAVVSAELTRSVNPGTELVLGGVVPSVLTCRLTEAAGVQISPGDWLQVYHMDGTERRFVGSFLAGQPQRKGSTLVIRAEDCICRLEQDVSEWLNSLDGWPYTLQELGRRVCKQCGLSLHDGDILCDGIPMGKISGSGITGSRLLGWIAALAGCFVVAEGKDRVRFQWFAPSDIRIGPAAAPGTTFYYRDSLTRGAEVQPVECVRLRRNAADMGVSYPETAPGANIYDMSGNGLIGGMQAEHRLVVAETLYQRLQAMQYTACTLEVPATCPVMPGQLVEVTDQHGSYTVAVMRTDTRNGRTRLTCTGSARRDDPEALRDLQLQEQSGKYLALELHVDGLRAEAGDNSQRLSRLELDTENIRTRISRQEENEGTITQRMSKVEQTAEAVNISVRTLQTDGVDRVVTKSGYSFTDEGLIISKQGHQMRNLLDHTGMYVTRDGEVILQASHRGVEATDVTVRNYLIVGEHARFEDYDNGTACFYI